MSNIFIKYLIALSVLIPELLFSTEQDYSFRQYGIEDGLSQSTVFASLQDKIGFMWFGTSSGLNKYDGYNFTAYLNDPDDSTSIAGEVVSALFEDSDGTIWVGSIEGNVNKYHRETDSFTSIHIASLLSEMMIEEQDYYDYPLSFSRNHSSTVTSIIEDTNGNLWISTWGNGIFIIDKEFKKVNHFYFNNSSSSVIPTNRITKLVWDEDDFIWAATFGKGLLKCEQKKDKYIFSAYHLSAGIENGLSDDKLITLLLDSEKNLWIGTFYGGLNLLSKSEKSKSPSEAKFIRFEPNKENNSISNKTVMALIEDNSGNIWIGTFGSGLDKYNIRSGKFINFRHNPINQGSLADDDVLSLSVERSGIIWAGSHLGSGITKIQKNRAKFNLYTHKPDEKDGLSDNVIWSIYEDKSKVLWVGTYRGGLNRIDRSKNKFTYFQYSPNDFNSISSNHIRAITEDRFGNLWIGTYNKGLNLIDKRTAEVKSISNDPVIKNSLTSNQVQTILIDNNEYWIGTFGGGLNYYKSDVNPFNDDIKFFNFVNDPENPNSLSDNRVYKVFKDTKDNLWIGTFGGGLNKLDPSTGTFKVYRYNPVDAESIADDKILCITEDSDGYLWIGTFGGGLNKLDPATGKFKRFSMRDGFTTRVVYGILEDYKKNLWLSTDNGIYTIDYQTKKITRYDILDGVQSKEFNGGSYFKSESGELFFGGINGLNYFFPDSIKSSTFLPSVVISSISVQNEPIKGIPADILLTHDKNFITFEFASLDFTNPKENSYAYMLDGFDRDWQQTSSERRIANYTNLPPGSYTFRVKGSNSDGFWSADEARVNLKIIPPFWQRWWFIILVLLTVGSLIYYISTLRIKNLLAIEKLKTKIAADLHDNIGSGLTEISILSELAAFKSDSNKTESQKELRSISELSRQLIDSMSDIVWVVNPQRDSLHDLIVRLKNSYSETLNSLGISFRVSNLEKLKDIKLPVDFKQNLYLILKEAINNSIKHSKCSVIQLDANARKDFIEVSVTDDGVGLDENNISLGNGMKNIRQRAESIGGRVKWKSSPNQGTSIRFVGKRSGINKIKSFLNK
jgi:ligand-binding sensor domain-containing protein/two-component sensor histidine kinase